MGEFRDPFEDVDPAELAHFRDQVLKRSQFIQGNERRLTPKTEEDQRKSDHYLGVYERPDPHIRTSTEADRMPCVDADAWARALRTGAQAEP